MHSTGTVRLGCTDCHGGNAEIRLTADAPKDSPQYDQAKGQAHPQPRNPANASSSANPTRAYTQWLNEDWNYIRFVNPGDLRVAEKTCGTSGCHTAEVRKVQTSMMTHGAMLWSAALYNNGAFPLKTAHFGESYGPDGTPQRLLTFPPPTPEEISKKGMLPYLDPLERWEISQPGNVLRVFERGSKKKPEVGNPSLEEDPGKPGDQAERARLRHRVAHRSRFSRIAEDPPVRSAAIFPRHQRPGRRLPGQRLQRLPRDLRQ